MHCFSCRLRREPLFPLRSFFLQVFACGQHSVQDATGAQMKLPAEAGARQRAKGV